MTRRSRTLKVLTGVLAPLLLVGVLSLATPNRAAAAAGAGLVAVGLVMGFAGAYDGLTRFGSWLGGKAYEFIHV